MTSDLRDDRLLDAVPEINGYRVLEPCILISKLGAGAMGAVYRARHLNLDLDVAVKCMRTELALENPDCVSRFQREARVAADVNSPHLIRVYDVNQRHGLHYLVMELVKGETVQGRVRRRGPLDAAEAIAIAVRATMGIAAAHARGIFHRDIKPENILISHAGDLKVADLGLAKAAAGFDSLATSTHTMMGTPQYMPPEQFEGSSRVVAASDVYALGATLYFMLAGRHPFPGETLTEIMRQVCLGQFPDIRELRDDLEPGLVALIRRATSRDPARRYTDASELRAALESLATAQVGAVDLTSRDLPSAPTEARISSALIAEIKQRLATGTAPSTADELLPATVRPSGPIAVTSTVAPAPPRPKRVRAAAVVLALLVVVASGATWLVRGDGGLSAADVAQLLAKAATLGPEQRQEQIAIFERVLEAVPGRADVQVLRGGAYRAKAEDLSRLQDEDGAFEAALRSCEILEDEDGVALRKAEQTRDRIAAAISAALGSSQVKVPVRGAFLATRTTPFELIVPYPAATGVRVVWAGATGAIAVPLADAAARGELRDLPEGPVSLEITITDRHGLESVLEHGIVVDSIAPKLRAEIVRRSGRGDAAAHTSVMSAGEGHVASFAWTRSPVEVSGTVEDATAVTFFVDGTETGVVAGPGGAWRSEQPLADGRHRIVIRAVDAAGNETTFAYEVHVDTVKPVIRVHGPADGTVVKETAIELDLLVRDDQTLAGVEVAGVELADVANGARVKRRVEHLHEGENLLVVIARDEAGNTATAEVRVIVDTTAPRLRIVSPGPGESIAPREISVEVVVEDENPGRVEINGAAAEETAPGRYVARLTPHEGQPLEIVAVAYDRAGNSCAPVSCTCPVGRACTDCQARGTCRTCAGRGEIQQDCTRCEGGHTHTSCASCQGRGRLSCRTCTGSGSTSANCGVCRGQGKVRCDACGRRRARIKCLPCGGRGKWKIGPLETICPTCNGQGIIVAVCDTCHDTKHVDCGACGGRGQVSSSCRSCNGQGFTETCRACSGQGTIPGACSVCSSRGYLTSDCRDCEAGRCRPCEGRGYRVP